MMLFMTSQNASSRLGTYATSHQSLFGRFYTPKTGHGTDVHMWNTWALDNGAFSGFDEAKFVSALKRLHPYRKACKFVVCPDVPFDWAGTLKLFGEWREFIRRLGYPIAIACQDGASVEDVPFDLIDAVFIGGSTEWKRQRPKVTGGDLFTLTPARVQMGYGNEVRDIIRTAKERGLWVHIGRQGNSPQQLWNAYTLGVNSVDATGEVFAPNEKFKWITQTMWNIHNPNNQAMAK